MIAQEKLSIPYAFKLRGVPRRGVHERSLFCYETVDFNIPVLSNEEAPVAARIPTSRGTDFQHEGPVGNGICDLRLYEGRLLKLVLSSSTTENEPCLLESLRAFLEGDLYRGTWTLDAIFGGQREMVARILDGNDKEKYKYGHELRKYDEKEWASIDNADEVETQRAAARERYANLVVIEGKIWTPVAEPVYVFDFHTYYNAPSHLTVKVAPISKLDGRRKRVFGLNEWSIVADAAADEFGRTPNEAEMAEVLIPAAFTYRGVIPQVLESLVETYRYEGDLIQNMNKDNILRWAEFRDAVQKAAASPDDEEVVADAIDEAIRYMNGCTEMSLRSLSALKRVVNFWDMRPITPLHEGNSQAPKP